VAVYLPFLVRVRQMWLTKEFICLSLSGDLLTKEEATAATESRRLARGTPQLLSCEDCGTCPEFAFFVFACLLFFGYYLHCIHPGKHNETKKNCATGWRHSYSPPTPSTA